MLQGLAEVLAHRSRERREADPQLAWKRVSQSELAACFPFWQAVDIKRIQNSLLSLGLIAVDAGEQEDQYFLAIIDSSAQTVAANEPSGRPSAVQSPAGASVLPRNWQPNEDALAMCRQHSIPERFARELVPEFVNYWRERGTARFSWSNAFFKHVLKQWRNEQSHRGGQELASTMSEDWRPSGDAQGILQNAGISPEFIEDAVPEFVLYWRERGEVHGAWNTRFIEHIRRQWAKYSASFGHDATPRPIAEDWQPSAECYEILQLAEIDEDYARSRVAEFVMYWRDSKQVKSSWNTVFLQFVKQGWARKLTLPEHASYAHAEDKTIAGSSQQKIRERFQQIADRSWAD